MSGYPHIGIVINSREVKLPEILSGQLNGLSAFELETFAFIRAWLTGVMSFPLQTSGSTGSPKEITLTRNQFQQSARRTITALSLTESDTAFVCLDTKYIAGKMMLVRALENNMKIVAVEPSSNPLKQIPEESGINFAAFVPLQLEEMLKHSNCIKRLNEFKVIIIGGGAINATLHQQIRKLTCAVFATYGMTETVSHVALQRLNGNEAQENFITLPDINITVDERDCMVIQLPEFSEKIITNDLVELQTPTSFRWLGRVDNVINSGGFKISPEKIEKEIELIFQDKKIEQSFFVFGLPDNRLGQKLTLIIEGLLIGNDNEILQALAQRVYAYEIPKQILNLREFVRTETGKINRTKTISLISQ
jgi:O-succinylbenzoic acid--CoA ligase